MYRVCVGPQRSSVCFLYLSCFWQQSRTCLKESLGNMVTVEAESHHIGVKKKQQHRSSNYWSGVHFAPSLLSFPFPLLCEGAREREKERETSMIEVSLRNKKEREMCGGHSRAVEGRRRGGSSYFRLMLAGLF